MPRTATPLKETRLSIRASDPDKLILRQAAQTRRLSVSQFVLQSSLEAAHAVLADPTEFRLSPEQWELFCRRLDTPAQTIPALTRLFAESEPSDA